MNTKRNIIPILLLIFSLLSCNVLKKSDQNKKEDPSTEAPIPKRVDGPKDKKDEVKAPSPTSEKNKTEGEEKDENVSASAIEMKMLDEINKVRSNPKGYVRYIDEYLQYFEKENFPSLGAEKRTAQELTRVLNNMSPLQKVSYHERLYKVAERHGKELKKRGDIYFKNPHIGKDGSTAERRIKRGTGLELNGENFGSAHDNPRYQLISLLIDAGVEGRGHRFNILDSRWNVAAFYNIGKIGEDPGCWLQLFAYEPEDKPSRNAVEKSLTLSEAEKLVAKATYMKPEERAMLNEINLLRSNPKAYVKQIEAYKEKVRTGEVFPFVPVDEELAIADGLIKELKSMKPLSLLKPDLKLYNVATAHGQFLKQKGQPDLNPNPHAGRYGKGAHERITAGADMSKGGENYQGTFVPMRETLIGLLVDSGIPGFGHRKALLNPAWDHGVCHNFGSVRSAAGPIIPDNWLQNFAKK